MFQNRWLIVSLTCSIILFTTSRSVAAEQEPLSEVFRRWNATSAAIVTAKIKCFHIKMMPDLGDHEGPYNDVIDVSMADSEFRDMFRNEILKVVESRDAAQAMRRVTDDHSKVNQKILFVYSRLTITQDGSTAKNQEDADDYRSFILQSPQKFITYDPRDNLAVIADPAMHADMYSARSLRFSAPSLSSDEIKVLKVDLPAVSGLAIASGSQIVVEFEPESAWIARAAYLNAATGGVVREFFHSSPKRYPGGIEMPTISASAAYTISPTGVSRLLLGDIFLIEEAAFNEEISAADMALRIPKGTSVRNTQREQLSHSQRGFIAKDDIADAAAVVFGPLFTKDVDAEMPTRGNATSEARSWLVWLNVATVLVVIVFWLFRSLRTRK